MPIPTWTDPPHEERPHRTRAGSVTRSFSHDRGRADFPLQPRIDILTPRRIQAVGGVAQWLEQGLHKAKVTGSNPVAAIKSSRRDDEIRVPAGGRCCARRARDFPRYRSTSGATSVRTGPTVSTTRQSAGPIGVTGRSNDAAAPASARTRRPDRSSRGIAAGARSSSADHGAESVPLGGGLPGHDPADDT